MDASEASLEKLREEKMINDSYLSLEESLALANKYVEIVGDESVARIITTSHGLPILYSAYRESDGKAYVSFPSNIVGADQLPMWLSFDEILHFLYSYSEEISGDHSLCVLSPYEVEKTDSFLSELVRMGAAYGEEVAVVLDTKRRSWEQIRNRKKRWVVKKEVEHALSLGLTVRSRLGGADDLLASSLTIAWERGWRESVRGRSDLEAADSDGLMLDFSDMRVSLETIATALDPNRVITTTVYAPDNTPVFSAVATTAIPGWASLTHVISDRDALAALGGEGKPPRATYLAIDDLLRFLGENGLRYLDLGTDAESEAEEKLYYKKHYRSATPDGVKTACVLVFSDPSAVYPDVLGLNSFCQGKLVVDEKDLWWHTPDNPIEKKEN